MISNTVERVEKTSDFETSDAAREAIYGLDAGMVTEDLKNVLEYAQSIKSGNGNDVPEDDHNRSEMNLGID